MSTDRTTDVDIDPLGVFDDARYARLAVDSAAEYQAAEPEPAPVDPPD